MMKIFQVHLSEIEGPEPNWALEPTSGQSYIQDLSEEYQIGQRLRICGAVGSYRTLSDKVLEFGRCQITAKTIEIDNMNCAWVNRRTMNPYVENNESWSMEEEHDCVVILTMDKAIRYITSKMVEPAEVLCTFHNRERSVVGCMIAFDISKIQENLLSAGVCTMAAYHDDSFYKVDLIRNKDEITFFVDKVLSNIEKERLERLAKNASPVSKRFIRNHKTCTAGIVLYPINTDVIINLTPSVYLSGDIEYHGLQVDNNGNIVDCESNQKKLEGLRSKGFKSVILYDLKDKYQMLDKLRPLYVFKTTSTESVTKIKCLRTN